MNTPASPDFDGALLPCPFCGSAAKMFNSGVMASDHHEEQWCVSCSSEDCNTFTLGVHDTRFQAIEKWNTRANACRVEVVTVEELLLKCGIPPESDWRNIYRPCVERIQREYPNGVIVKEKL